jgi:5,10-methylenetetrahydromethanopterin reductase
MEIWTTTVGMPAQVARAAAEAEASGWDGIGLPYAPTMAPDPYVCLAAAAGATERLKIGNWVATPASHTPASAAGSIKTVQALSDGRAVFGLGRGDSALAYLGMAPAPVEFFEAYVSRLRNYLQDDPQPFDLDLDGGGHFPSVERMGFAQHAPDARFAGFMQGIAAVPLDMVATGPRVLGIAARHADRVTTAVGADPERVSWAVGVVHAARKDAGVDRPVSLGAWVPVAVTDDLGEGRRMLSGVTTSMARFTAMYGKAVAPVSDADRDVYERVHDAYELHAHFQEGSPQSRQVSEDFADRFAVIGSPATCIARLRALIDLGIERFVISGPSPVTTPDLAATAARRFVEEVMPALR